MRYSIVDFAFNFTEITSKDSLINLLYEDLAAEHIELGVLKSMHEFVILPSDMSIQVTQGTGQIYVYVEQDEVREMLIDKIMKYICEVNVCGQFDNQYSYSATDFRVVSTKEVNEIGTQGA